MILEEELQWVTNPLPGTSEDHPPLGGKPSEVEVGKEATAIPPAICAASYDIAREDHERSIPIIRHPTAPERSLFALTYEKAYYN